MTAKTHEERILELYARYRRSGWRFTRWDAGDSKWGISFVCAGTHVRIMVINGACKAFAYTGEDVVNAALVDIHIDTFSNSRVYETLYRRLDKKAGVTRGK